MTDPKEKDTIFAEVANENSDVIFYHNRKATFKKWCFDKIDSPCSSEALARAGFIYSGTRNEPSVATCVFCFKEMIFEEQDDPWEEHRSHTRNCCFVELNKPYDETWTVHDFIFLLAGRCASEQRRKVIRQANSFYAAGEEIMQMAEKAINAKR